MDLDFTMIKLATGIKIQGGYFDQLTPQEMKEKNVEISVKLEPTYLSVLTSCLHNNVEESKHYIIPLHQVNVIEVNPL